jgi:hypothetical protein
MPEHFVEPASAMSGEILRAGGSSGRDGREDPATRREDLHVTGAALAKLELAFPTPGEQEVGMGIDEAWCHRPASRVQPSELSERIALGLDERLNFAPRPRGENATLPRGNDRRGLSVTITT